MAKTSTEKLIYSYILAGFTVDAIAKLVNMTNEEVEKILLDIRQKEHEEYFNSPVTEHLAEQNSRFEKVSEHAYLEYRELTGLEGKVNTTTEKLQLKNLKAKFLELFMSANVQKKSLYERLMPK